MPPHDSLLIVTFLSREWSRYARRPHWTAIARHVDVLAMEPPAALLMLFRHPRRLLHYLRQGRKPRLSASGVVLWRPLSLVSTGLAYRIGWLARFDGWWIKRQLRPVLKSMVKPNQAVVSFVVKGHQFYLRDVVDADHLCFEVTDEYRVLIPDERLDSRAELAEEIYQLALLGSVRSIIQQVFTISTRRPSCATIRL